MRLASLWAVWLWLQNSVSTAVTFGASKELALVFAYTADHAYPIRYYIFVAACVLARKNELIKNACLAAALLLPAVAALHGIILAALHVPGAFYPASTSQSCKYSKHENFQLTYI